MKRNYKLLSIFLILSMTLLIYLETSRKEEKQTYEGNMRTAEVVKAKDESKVKTGEASIKNLAIEETANDLGLLKEKDKKDKINPDKSPFIDQGLDNPKDEEKDKKEEDEKPIPIEDEDEDENKDEDYNKKAHILHIIDLVKEYFKMPENLWLSKEYEKFDSLLDKYLIDQINEENLEAHKEKLYFKIIAYIENALISHKENNLVIDKSMYLNKDYNTIEVKKDDIVLDLNKKFVKQLIIDGNNCRVKNGTLSNILIKEDKVNLILEDIADNTSSQHDFYGGGIKSIVLKGNTSINGSINIRSALPIQIRGESLRKDNKINGTIKIRTPAKIIVGLATKRIEVYMENEDIDIRNEVEEIIAFANIKVKIGKGIKIPKIQAKNGAIVSIEDSNIVEEEIIYPKPHPNPKPDIKPNPIPEPEPEPEPGTGPQPEEKSDQPTPENLKAISPSGENINDGKITGTSSGMEYRLKGQETFIDIDGNVLSGLSPGIYEIRYKGKEGYNPGDISEIRLYPYIKVDFDNGKINKYMGSETEIVIPSKILVDGEEFEVTEIGKNAFEENITLEKIVLPDTIITIGESAFKKCVKLESIIVPDSVIEINNFAFTGCTNLQSVKLGKQVKKLPSSIFLGCTKLKSIIIPESVRSIGTGAFQDCISLESIDIPKNVSAIENSAFLRCKALKDISIPESVNALGNLAFKECSSLETISIPNAIKTIREKTFYGCSSLKEVNLSSELNTIEKLTFVGCSSLAKIVIPDKVTSIGEETFYGCSSLKEVNLSVNLKVIEKWTFRSCVNLESIIIPHSVKTIESNLFQNCINLKVVSIGKDVKLIGQIPYPKNTFVEAYNKNNKIEGKYIYNSENKAWEKEILELP